MKLIKKLFFNFILVLFLTTSCVTYTNQYGEVIHPTISEQSVEVIKGISAIVVVVALFILSHGHGHHGHCH